MDSERIARDRLVNQAMTSTSMESPEEVVAWMGAMQAQEYAPAKWSVGQRALDLDDAALERAIADGSVVRTHILRSTWHFVAPQDLRWMQALTAPRVRAFLAYYDRQLGIDSLLLVRSADVISAYLAGGRQGTRRELATALQHAGIEARGQKLAHLVMHAELDALICSGALRGKQHTYGLVDERISPTPDLTRDEALGELTLRYFRSHGPATLKDFQWWSSLTAADAKRGIEIAGDEITSQNIEGRTYYSGGRRVHTELDTPIVHLLQCYDEYIIGYSESRDVLNTAGLASPAGEGVWDPIYIHALLIDGQLAGTWRRKASSSEITVEMRFLRPLSEQETSKLAAEASRYGRFAGIPVRLSV